MIKMDMLIPVLWCQVNCFLSKIKENTKYGLASHEFRGNMGEIPFRILSSPPGFITKKEPLTFQMKFFESELPSSCKVMNSEWNKNQCGTLLRTTSYHKVYKNLWNIRYIDPIISYTLKC